MPSTALSALVLPNIRLLLVNTFDVESEFKLAKELAWLKLRVELLRRLIVARDPCEELLKVISELSRLKTAVPADGLEDENVMIELLDAFIVAFEAVVEPLLKIKVESFSVITLDPAEAPLPNCIRLLLVA